MILITFKNTLIEYLLFTNIIQHKVNKRVKYFFLFMVFKLIVIYFVEFIVKISHLCLVHLIIIIIV